VLKLTGDKFYKMENYEKCDFEKCHERAEYDLSWLCLDSHGREESEDPELHYLLCEKHLFDLAKPVISTMGLPDEVAEHTPPHRIRPDILESLIKRLRVFQ